MDPKKEKIAVVTGSSSGFGLLTVVDLAKAGFRVVASMRDLNRRSALDQAAAGVADSHRRAPPRCDRLRFHPQHLSKA